MIRKIYGALFTLVVLVCTMRFARLSLLVLFFFGVSGSVVAQTTVLSPINCDPGVGTATWTFTVDRTVLKPGDQAHLTFNDSLPCHEADLYFFPGAMGFLHLYDVQDQSGVHQPPLDVEFLGMCEGALPCASTGELLITYDDDPTDPNLPATVTLSTTMAIQWYSPLPALLFTFTVLPATDPGPCTTDCEAVAGQPINLSTGDVWTSKTDYSVPGLAGGLSLTRTWNSLWNQNSPPFAAGMFGLGWTSDFEERLRVLSSNRIQYWQGSGNTWIFGNSCGGCSYSVLSPPNQHATLSFNTTTNLYTLQFANGTTKTFNSLGYLTALTDRNGNQTTSTYDASNRITKITAPGGQSLTFSYALTSDPNRVTSMQDSVGTVASYSYSNSLLTRATYADGGQLNYAYDANNNVTGVTDDQGKTLETHTYDNSGRGLTSARANGVDAVTIQYGTGSTTLTDSMNNTTTYTFSTIARSNFLTGIQGPGCDSCGGRNNQSFSLDSSANRLSAVDPNGNTVSYTYDGSSNVLTRTDAVGTWTYTYNSFGEVLTAQDPLGNTTTNTYDANGNLLTTTTPPPASGQSGSTTTFTYDTKGELLTITDPLINVTTITYFSSGLINTIKDAQKNVTTFGYDARGNRTSMKDALSNTTTFAYDSMNRLTKITYPTSPATTNQFAYDKRGRRISVTDQNSKVTQYAYDDADRLTTVTDAANNVTSYGYDTENNLTSIMDASNDTTTFSYDHLDRVTKTLFPSNLFETYLYDNNGNLISKTDRNSHAITYTYDQLNRLTKKTYPDNSTVNYTYDKDSRLTQVADPTGTYQFAFDNMGRLTGTTTSYAFLTGRNLTSSYSYDAASNRKTFTDPEGGATSYAYDTLNRLSTLTPPSAFARGSFGFTYDALSRRTQLTRPNKVSTNYSYDSLSHLLSVTHLSGRTTLDGASYTVDAAGNRLTRTPLPSGTATNFGYDAIYELLTATQGSTTKESYTYDVVGNRLSALNSSGWTYNTSNELTSRQGVTYIYDNNGNITSKTDSTGSTNYTWDFENRLTAVTLPGTGGTVSFKYDPFGRRIYKSSSAGTSVFAYDGDNLIEETNASGAVVARYSEGPNIDEPLAMLRSSTTSFYQADGLGSVTSLSNGAGSLAQTYTFDSFGKTTASSGSLVNPFRFTGRDFDTETNLQFSRARYYDPNVGRFLSEDPESFNADFNFYRYVGNDPATFTDPFGLAKCVYSIADHTLICTSDYSPPVGPTWQVVVGPDNVSSGNGKCKDNPKCGDKLFTGPIKPGNYKMNPDTRPGQTDRYRLEPQPTIPGWKVYLGLERGGFELHPGHRTLGCINVLKDDPNAMQQYNRLRQLLDSQTGSNFLQVVP